MRLWFIYHYDTISRGNAVLCVFWDCVLADHRKLLCVALYCCSHCAVTLRRTSKCELWPRLVTLQWSELWHVNSLQSLCWEIGDKSRSWNKVLYCTLKQGVVAVNVGVTQLSLLAISYPRLRHSCSEQSLKQYRPVGRYDVRSTSLQTSASG